MGTKSKGTRAERELLHNFWQVGWGCIRVSGSGSVPLPVPDLLAGNKKRWLAIECKSVAGKSKFLYPADIDQIVEFANIFGAEPWIAMRFDRKGWYFLKANELTQTKSGNYNITFKICENKGIRFEDLTK